MADEINLEHAFDRIRALYKLSSDAALARLLMIAPQDVPRFRKGRTLPHKQILHTCHAADWPYIFLGQKPGQGSEATVSIEMALETLAKAGYRVTLEKKD